MAFSKDFLWGAASAAHQVEGAWNEIDSLPAQNCLCVMRGRINLCEGGFQR